MDNSKGNDSGDADISEKISEMKISPSEQRSEEVRLKMKLILEIYALDMAALAEDEKQAKLDKSIEEKKAVLQDIVSEIDRIDVNVEEMTNKAAAIRLNTNMFVEKTTLIKNLLHREKETTQHLTKSTSALFKEINKTDAALKQMDAKIAAAVAAKNLELESYKSAKDEQIKRRIEISKEMKDEKKKIEATTLKSKALQAELDKIEVMESQIKELEGAVGELQIEIDAGKKAEEEFQSNIQKLFIQDNSITEQGQQLKLQIDAANQRSKELVDHLNDVAHLSNVVEKSDIDQWELDPIFQRVLLLTEAYTGAKTNLENAIKDFEELEVEITDANNTEDEMEAELNNARRDLAELDGIVKNFEAEIVDIEQDATEKKAILDKQVEKAKNEEAELEMIINDLKSQLAQETKELQAVEEAKFAELEELKKKLTLEQEKTENAQKSLQAQNSTQTGTKPLTPNTKGKSPKSKSANRNKRRSINLTYTLSEQESVPKQLRASTSQQAAKQPEVRSDSPVESDFFDSPSGTGKAFDSDEESEFNISFNTDISEFLKKCD